MVVVRVAAVAATMKLPLMQVYSTRIPRNRNKTRETKREQTNRIGNEWDGIDTKQFGLKRRPKRNETKREFAKKRNETKRETTPLQKSIT